MKRGEALARATELRAEAFDFRNRPGRFCATWTQNELTAFQNLADALNRAGAAYEAFAYTLRPDQHREAA